MSAVLTTDMATTVARSSRRSHDRDRGPPRQIPDLHPTPPGQPRPTHGQRTRPRLLDGAGPTPDGADSRVGFLPEGPGLAALESPELAEVLAELLARYDPAYVPPPDLAGPFDPAHDHLLVIFEGGRAYLYRLDNTPHATKPLLTVIPRD
jgi:hypothetical protein